MKKSISLFYILLLSCNSFAVEMSFYDDRERGWFWHETYPEPVEDEPTAEEPEKAVEEETSSENQKDLNVNVEVTGERQPIELTVKWLRENFPKIKEMAIDNPTVANVRRYHYVQRIMLDKAHAFALMSKEVSLFEAALDENLLRPQNSATIYKHKVAAQRTATKTIRDLTDEVGLFLFYDKKCTYCLDQAVLLKRLTVLTGIEVLAVSLDGSALPNNVYPDFVVDTQNLREKYRINTTPTVYIVKKDGTEYHNLVNGIVAINNILERILLVAKRENWITEAQYAQTQTTRPVLATDKPGSNPTLFDEDKIMNEPDYLADRLKAVLESKYNNSQIPVYGYQGDAQ